MYCVSVIFSVTANSPYIFLIPLNEGHKNGFNFHSKLYCAISVEKNHKFEHTQTVKLRGKTH